MTYEDLANLKLHLKKNYGGSKPTYAWELCCKSLYNYDNECPEQQVCFKFKNCVNINGSVHEVKVGDAKIEYQNLTTCSVLEGPNYEQISDGLQPFNLDPQETKNTLCVSSVSIPVTPHCIEDLNTLLEQEQCLSHFVDFVNCDPDVSEPEPEESN
jgi:hypothetical protein